MNMLPAFGWRGNVQPKCPNRIPSGCRVSWRTASKQAVFHRRERRKRGPHRFGLLLLVVDNARRGHFVSRRTGQTCCIDLRQKSWGLLASDSRRWPVGGPVLAACASAEGVLQTTIAGAS